eukprot:1553757-Rhodomonas_salina.4
MTMTITPHHNQPRNMLEKVKPTWSLAGRWAESSLKVHSCTATKVSLLLCSWGFATSSTAGSAEHE